MNKIKFDDYVNMIRSRAHYYSKCYRMEYSEVEAQGFLIYCMCIKYYQKNKASFSTYLYRNLSGRLRDFCRNRAQQENKECCLEEIFDEEIASKIGFDFFVARENGPSVKQLLDYAKCYLSGEAYSILKWLLTDQLAELGICPSLSLISKASKIPLLVLDVFWQELRDFWNIKGRDFYNSPSY